jgi:23S rRNA pseudouridine1911/1915/1917 synthase
MDALSRQQNEGMIFKEYCAFASESETMPSGFPLLRPAITPDFLQGETGLQLKSAFRPYGPGRKEVRPVIRSLPGNALLSPAYLKRKELALDGGNEYVTCIFKLRKLRRDIKLFNLKISKGFRHQLRCHLAWMGTPILNDTLYGGHPFGNGFLALRAFRLEFIEPSSERKIVYSISEWKNLESSRI